MDDVKIVEFPYPDDADRFEILATTSRVLATAEALPHRVIAKKTAGWSAAELAAIWSEAALLAVADERSIILTEDYLDEEVSRVVEGRESVLLARLAQLHEPGVLRETARVEIERNPVFTAEFRGTAQILHRDRLAAPGVVGHRRDHAGHIAVRCQLAGQSVEVGSLSGF